MSARALRWSHVVAWAEKEEQWQPVTEAGFDHHLVKPPDMDVLQSLLAGVAAASAELGARALH